MYNVLEKKKLAVVLCSTTNQMFAVGNVLIGLKKHFSLPEKDYDVILYVSGNMNKKDENALKQIYKDIIINYYKSPLEKTIKNANCALIWSLMAFARYEVFTLLDQYNKILYLDTDVLIQKDIIGLLDINKDISVSYEGTNLRGNIENKLLTENFTSSKYNLDVKVFNSGVFFINDSIKNGMEIIDWCYSKAEEWKAADQIILNLMVQEFNIDIADFTNKYNRYVFDNLDDAFIVHSCAWNLKFWDGIDNKDWKENNMVWISYGGLKYKNLKKQLINTIAWWIPIRSLRDKFRLYFYKKNYIR